MFGTFILQIVFQSIFLYQSVVFEKHDVQAYTDAPLCGLGIGFAGAALAVLNSKSSVMLHRKFKLPSNIL